MYAGFSPNNRITADPYVATGGELIIPLRCSSNSLLMKNGLLLNYIADYGIQNSNNYPIVQVAAVNGDRFLVIDLDNFFSKSEDEINASFRVMGMKGTGLLLEVKGFGVSGSTFQWCREGVPISGATSSTYTQVAADLNATLTVQVGGLSLSTTFVRD